MRVHVCVYARVRACACARVRARAHLFTCERVLVCVCTRVHACACARSYVKNILSQTMLYDVAQSLLTNNPRTISTRLIIAC